MPATPPVPPTVADAPRAGPRWVLLGDGESPHLLKWARALAPRVDLWAASTRGFAPGFDAVVPEARRLALRQTVDVAGGNLGVLRSLPVLARWLKAVRPQWVHAHYLTSHGTLAWLAQRMLGAPGGLIASAWGSDILVSPRRSAAVRGVTTRVLRAAALSTSDSQVMAGAMRAMGARDVMVFPFGLEDLPRLTPPAQRTPHLYFANRALEPLYRPDRVIATFARIVAAWPEATLVVAHDGSQRAAMQRQAVDAGLADQVRFVGRLDATTQAGWYGRATGYLSLPDSDSVSVSVLEAMAHGALPILSDLPANRELVRDGDNGLILPDGADPVPALRALLLRADAIGRDNHTWVARQALFPDAVDRFLARVATLPVPR